MKAPDQMTPSERGAELAALDKQIVLPRYVVERAIEIYARVALAHR